MNRFKKVGHAGNLRAGLFVILSLTVAVSAAPGQHETTHQQAGATPTCIFSPATSVHCGRTPTTAIDRNGRLYAAYVIGEEVLVSRSEDMGHSWSDGIVANDVAEEIYTNGENRPKIAFGPDGEIYTSWTAIREGRFAGDIRFARSMDGGRRFEPVRTVNDDGLQTSHRFETLFTDSRGNLYLAWLDKRDQVAVLEQGGEYNGAALYYTVSTDRGKTFAPNRKVADFSCECCRIAMSETHDGDVAVFWRHIFGDNVRDHAFAVIGYEGVVMPLRRPVDDNWRIEACPHHGPSMVTASDDAYHFAWFSLGDRKGINYGRYDPRSGEMSSVRTIATTGSGHAHLARDGNALYLAWKQFDGERTHIKLLRSDDEGGTWSEPVSLASTHGGSDHPFLLERAGKIWLSWHTGDEGLRILPVPSSGRTP